MNKAALKQETSRPVDPNVLQRQASNPQQSVWVGASAGSGKTKVLTDRILRLLLPNKEGKPGTKPNKILALTFTKAGASVMTLRISKSLSNWVVLTEKELIGQLEVLLGYNPTKQQIETARKLFSTVIDTPGGLKIMTIHSFCQSVLGRFPIEAGLPPNFKALDEKEAESIISKARERILNRANEEKGGPLAEAVNNIATTENEEQFQASLKNILAERHQLKNILKKNFSVEGLYSSLCQHFDIPEGKTEESLLHEFSSKGNFDETGLKKACKALAQGSSRDIDKSIIIQSWLDAKQQDRIKLYESYKFVFLTKTEGTIAKTLATKKAANNNPDLLDVLSTEAHRILEHEDTVKAAHTTSLTRDLFLITNTILEEYSSIKSQAGLLDFDDLILHTLNLLQGKTPPLKNLDATPWIRYKLDQGIDHVLVDEAQDTNPEQWEIMKALCDDFFDSAEDTQRTLFVVGDEKQSIFSFQRASPEKFHQMQDFFREKINNDQASLEKVDFNISFRSVQSVLEVVDTVFDDPVIRTGLGQDVIRHKSYRYTQAGLVELWPLFENPEKDRENNPWAPPVDIKESSSGAAQMASHIGKTIAEWMANKEILESHDRPIQPGDIMILVRSRTAFINQLVRALKTRNIPVSGVDRMVLNDQLVVQDLYAAAQFSLLPNDDLTLACLLKTPFIGWNEEKLFDCAYNRQNSLWDAVKKSGETETIDWLKMLIKKSGTETPYNFFVHLLQHPCPADKNSGLTAIKKRLGEECLDPIDEFLNETLKFEDNDIPTLQNFLHAQQQNTHEIKRQIDENSNAVQIMTVHAAKGLQAPIVILPDTIRTANSLKPERILWPNATGEPFPYFCPQSKQAPEKCKSAIATIIEKQNEEYRRLLYVAMTRAENRLYIGGYRASRNPLDDSWYIYAKKAFSKLQETEELAEGILRHSNPATDKPDKIDKNRKNDNKQENKRMPDWLFKSMPEEPDPPKPLVPSRPTANDEPVLSPLNSGANHRFKRGNITHKLLQILPDLPPEKQKSAAKKYIKKAGQDFSSKIQSEIISETLAILQDKKFAPIFGKGSIAEVPVTGMIDNKTLISGQIDRLLVSDTEVLIIDFKTNRPPPKEEKNVPEIYKKQMKAYADTIRQIYPDKTVKAALLWTDGPMLTELKNL